MTRSASRCQPKNSLERFWFHVGIAQGQRELLQSQIEYLWGPLSETQHQKLHSLHRDKRFALGRALFDFTSRDDHERWLAENPETSILTR